MAKLVNWYEFNKRLKDKKILLFSATEIQRLFGVSKVAAGFLLHRYTARGYLARVKRGLYVFPDALPPELFLANKIYEPSYVSLELALSYYRVIPENVYEITSITTKATRRFEKLGKIYSYRRIKKTAFTGYTIEKQKGFSFQIADPEKAFVDCNYFRMLDDLKPLSRYDKEKINPAKALDYASLLGNKKLVSIIKRTLQ
jgi:predicted transcriptional regulator of viral defense system